MFHPSWEVEVESEIKRLTPSFKRAFRPFRRELLRTAIMTEMIDSVQNLLVAHLESSATSVEQLFDARGLVGTSHLWNMSRWFLQNDKRRLADLLTSRERRAQRCFEDYEKARDVPHLNRVFRYELTRAEATGPENRDWNPHEDPINNGQHETHWALAVADGHWS